MTSDGAELRFWMYVDTTNEVRYLYDLGATAQAFTIRLGADGKITTTPSARRPATPPTPTPRSARTRSAGPSSASSRLHVRHLHAVEARSATDPWTPLKAAGATGFAIPIRGTNTITATHGTLFRAYANANLWLDDVRYADDRHLRPRRHHAADRPATLLAADHAADQGGAIDLSWSAATDNVGVTGYKLYRGTAAGVYGAPTRARRRHHLHRRHRGHRHPLLLRRLAVDAAGNESAKSPEAAATPPTTWHRPPRPALPPPAAPSRSRFPGPPTPSPTWPATTSTATASRSTPSPLTATTFTDTGRADGTTYTYRVAAVDTHGNASAQCAAVSRHDARRPRRRPTFDGTFESGTDGAALVPAWTLSGTPQRAEYDTARAKNGTTVRLDPGPPPPAYAGVCETARRHDRQRRRAALLGLLRHHQPVPRPTTRLQAHARTAPAPIQFIQSAGNGQVYVYTNRAGVPGYTANAYTRGGHLRDRLDRVPHRLRLRHPDLHAVQARQRRLTPGRSSRRPAPRPTRIPCPRRTDRTTTANLLFRAYQNANLWLDDVRFSDTGFVDPPPVATCPSRHRSTAAVCHAGMDHGAPDCGDCHAVADGHPGTPSDCTPRPS